MYTLYKQRQNPNTCQPACETEWIIFIAVNSSGEIRCERQVHCFPTQTLFGQTANMG